MGNVRIYGPSQDGGIPVGLVCMWSGSTTDIPSGWALCNGSNGTPDLRGRFIVGAGSSYSVGATGGSASVTLTEEQMPSHSHEITIRPASSSVSLSVPQSKGSASAAGADVETTTAGGGKSHENRPPYYALCYIMKI